MKVFNTYIKFKLNRFHCIEKCALLFLHGIIMFVTYNIGNCIMSNINAVIAYQGKCFME